MKIYTNPGDNAENVVPGGWVKELSSAKAAASKEPSAAANLRCAKAASKLRQFDKVSRYCKAGLAMRPSAEEKTQLSRLARVAAEDLRQAKREGFEEIKQDLIKKAFSGLSVDDCQLYDGGMLYTNLNFLQASATLGDIRVLELAVALGAALDFKVQKGRNYPGVTPRPAPPGITALALCCSCLVSMRKAKLDGPQLDPRLDEAMDKLADCCVLLVMLGADCSARFDVEKLGRETGMLERRYLLCCERLGLLGKSVKELALESGSEELVRAVETMSTKDGAMRNAFCRCGSRLPWLECHAGQKFDSFCAEESSEPGTKLFWRFSPLARCGCNKTNEKTHFKCCWNSTDQYFQDDQTGRLRGEKVVTMDSMSPFNRRVIDEWIKHRSTESKGEKNPLLFPARDANGLAIEGQLMSASDHRQKTAAYIRLFGIGRDDAPYTTKSLKWDREVIAGTVENIDDFFVWTELHWMVPKSELVLRTKEWNEALEMYCDQAKLQGERRAQVVEAHKAELVAPCGNPACSNRESKLKEFKACSRCKAIAYCSKNCQRIHWKSMHKATCNNFRSVHFPPLQSAK